MNRHFWGFLLLSLYVHDLYAMHGLSPYAYCAGNPVILVDPDGKDWVKNKENSSIFWTDACDSEETVPQNCEYVGKSYQGISVNNYESFYDGILKGVDISLCYNGNNRDEEYHWIQSIKTNYKSKIYSDEEYIDTENSDNPFYYKANEELTFSNEPGCDYEFMDRPARISNISGVYWEGELTLVKKTDKGYIPHVTVSYGFKNSYNGFILSNLKVTNQSDFQRKKLEEYNKKLDLDNK